MNRKNTQKQMMEILRQLSLLTQFGLSLLTPILLCLALCCLLTTRLHVGGWVYLPGFFFGLGGSGTVAWKFYLNTIKHENKEEESRAKKISFNRHD